MCDRECSNCGSLTNEKNYTYEDIEHLAHYLQEKVSIQPKIGIICGTGLGAVTDVISDPTILDYSSIPDFPLSTVEGHAGCLLFGHIRSVPVVCMQGRFHLFEGYHLSTVAMPVRLMKLMGVEMLLLSNAAGGLNPDFEVGDIMLIRDHLNMVGMAGVNPLRGPNEERFGPRFPPMNESYDKEILDLARKVAAEKGLKVKEGVYACLGGPNFETVAELRALRILGADAVGMSTVHEVISGRHCGIRCFGISLITNMCVMEYDSDESPDHGENLEVGKQNEEEVKVLVEEVVGRLGKIL